MRQTWWIWPTAALAATAMLRYAVIEPAHIGQICAAGAAPWWCAPRDVLIGVFASGALGLAALAVSVVATFNRSSSWALVAVCLGIAGLVLYAFEASAVACLLGAMVLARTVAARRQPHAQREGET
jgi:hypothetical protein